MYTRQYKTKKTSTNSAETSTTNQFAPRRFVVQPDEEITKNQTSDLQAKSDKKRNLPNISVFPSNVTPQASPIQMKLTIGQPGDKYEQEADRLAADVVQQINVPETQQVQREAAPEEEEVRMKPMVQRLSGAGGTTATPDLEESIQKARSSGQPLTESIREPMEQAFGADFSGVKVHTDAQSDQLNQSIQAKAFTTGKDIFFRQGEYQPGNRGGQELIAHELTHVLQQNGMGVLGQESFSPFSAQTMVVQKQVQLNGLQKTEINSLLKSKWQIKESEFDIVRKPLEEYCIDVEMMEKIIKGFKTLAEFQAFQKLYDKAEEMNKILKEKGVKGLHDDQQEKKQKELDELKRKTPGCYALKTLIDEKQIHQVVKTQARKKLEGKNDFLDEYRIEFTGLNDEPKKKYFDPWYAHFHFKGTEAKSEMICGHLKTAAEHTKGGGTVFRSFQPSDMAKKLEQYLRNWPTVPTNK